jgi:hypothetical protein
VGRRERPPQIVIPSAKGLTLPGMVLPQGKGSEVHRFACEVIPRLAEAKGYQSVVIAWLEGEGEDGRSARKPDFFRVAAQCRALFDQPYRPTPGVLIGPP